MKTKKVRGHSGVGGMGRCKHPLSRQENEKLIELVRQNRALYDPNFHDHKDANFFPNIWSAIAADMGKTNMDGIEWKKKWRNLRDTYVKKIKGIRMNINVVAMRSWRFFEHMSFLEPYLEESMLREDIGSYVPVSDDTYSDTTSIKDEIDSNGAVGSDSLMIAPTIDMVETKLPRASNQSRKRKLQEVSEPCDEQWRLNERAYLSEPSMSECYSARSAAQIFFDSCALRMERLPARTQSFLQFQIAQLFFNAENPDLKPVPVIPLPEHSPPATLQCGKDLAS